MRFGYRKLVEDFVQRAGIEIDGSQPWDIQVHDERLYKRVIREQSIGLGEAYMDGWWTCERVDQLFERVFAQQLGKERNTLRSGLMRLRSAVVNLQSRARARQVNDTHYDLGNPLFEVMLDPNMVYTCGYWKNTDDLGQAQIQKLDMVCRKMNLKPGMKVLDIGCGFGSFMKYAAEHYGIEGVGICMSEQQIAYARASCDGLPVQFRYQDYRDLTERRVYDRVVSIGMFEAVGYKNFDTFMSMVDAVLKDDGALLLHTIASTVTQFPAGHFMDKYIFPNGYLPSLMQIAKSVEPYFLVLDLHNFGTDYDKTLMAWYANFTQGWPELEASGAYDERFRRMWEYYLLFFAGGFRARNWQLYQVVLAKRDCVLHDLSESRIYP